MRCVIVVLVSLGLVVCSRAQAQADNVRSLTVSEFVSKFERHNPRLALANALATRAKAKLIGASLWPNPKLAYQREHVFAGGVSQADNFITLGWSLDLSGKRSRRMAAARYGIVAAQSARDHKKLRLVLSGLRVYLAAAHTRLRADILRKGRAPLVRFIKVLRARAVGGDVTNYGALRLKLELGQHDDKVAYANTQLAAARRRLAVLLGDFKTVYDAGDPLTLPPSPTTSASTSSLVTSRKDYRAATARLRQADANLAAAKRSWVPLIGISAGIKTADAGTGRATGYVASVTLDIPLFSRGQKQAADARAARRIAIARRRVLEREVPQRDRIARQTLRRLVAQARAYGSKQVKAADVLVAKAQLRYRGGAGSIVELLDAYQLAQRVRLRALALRFKARQAELTLLRVRGQLPGAR